MSEWVNPMVRVVERLQALEDKRLCYGRVWDARKKYPCAVGALMTTEQRAKVLGGDSVAHYVDSGDRRFDADLAAWARGEGLTCRAIDLVESINDRRSASETPEERYVRVLRELTEISMLGEGEYAVKEREAWLE